MTNRKLIGDVKLIPTSYAAALDPPLARIALQALLEKRQSEFHEACAVALTDDLPMPDRKDYDLDRIRQLVMTLK